MIGRMSGIRDDLAQLVIVHTDELAWQPSPSPTVWRKRLELHGDAEQGRVTSVVRYDPESTFPLHDHPGGEEILVLSGTLSDDAGVYDAGTYILNPAGYSHAPRSREGCELFVKLRQYGGEDREAVIIEVRDTTWDPHPTEGVLMLPLYAQPGFPERMTMLRGSAGVVLEQRFPGGGEIFVTTGGFADEHGEYRAGSWVRYPAGSQHRAVFRADSYIYLKTGHLANPDPAY
jgi:anti-sigma factor ChrR (cupin superfamily)